MKTGTKRERKTARRVMGVIKHHHWLLVTLLVANAACMEALPIFLDRMMPSYAAIIASVSAVLFFGEIIPQAICTGPNQLPIASFLAPMTKCLMILLGVISYPISLLLDCLLRHRELNRFNNNDLKALIGLHSVSAL